MNAPASALRIAIGGISRKAASVGQGTEAGVL